MANYIKRLEVENEILKQTIRNVRSYLQSDKFRVTTTVEVNDIFLRLDEGQSILNEAVDDLDTNRNTLMPKCPDCDGTNLMYVEHVNLIKGKYEYRTECQDCGARF